MPLATNPLIQVTPGLMIWTVLCFLITLYVLKRYAFGPIQKLIDERRERIRQALDEADHARAEARQLLEEHRKLIGQAKSDAEGILTEARKVAEANSRRMREETEADRVYARALFDAVVEEDRLEPVREQLGQVVAAEAEVPELRELLRNPQLDPRARAAALEDLLAGGEELLRNFLLVLVDKGRTGQLEEIAREFERLVAEHEGIVNAELTTAVELS